MIPYFEQPSFSLGLITIHAFGVLVAVGILSGMYLIRRRAVAWGMDPNTAERLTIWILLGGFAGAHLVDRLVYYPADALANPWSLLRFWEGLSSSSNTTISTSRDCIHSRISSSFPLPT